MKLTTSKYGNISIRWQYDQRDNPVVTKAFLEKGEGKEKVTLKEIAIKRRYSEVHNKELARKFSLEKLVKHCFDRQTDFEDRVAIWDAYKNRVPKKEEKKVEETA